MKSIELWIQGRPSRQARIWWHWRYPNDSHPWKPKNGTSEKWYHVELHEYELLHPHHHDGQSMAWDKSERVSVGYGPTIASAASRAIKLAKKHPLRAVYSK